VSEGRPQIGLARKAVVGLLAIAAIAGVSLLAWHNAQPPQHCAPGMVAHGSRCCGEGQSLDHNRCSGTPERCAESMRATAEGCVPDSRSIAIAEGELKLAPSDWEATRRVTPYRAHVDAFLIDSHEVTEAAWQKCVDAGKCPKLQGSGEPGRPHSRDQLVFAAMGPSQRRYPWGNTGAVCRRVAFGLDSGPCARAAEGPQLAGSHPAGASPEGVHDLAGNAAEWSAPVDGYAEVRGGSWRDDRASALRTWSFDVLPESHQSSDVGFRCVYPPSAGGS
jgi:formylglycine-generating enzyme required for sulfatase activity